MEWLREMRRRLILGVAVFASVLLVVSAVLGSGLVDVSRFSLSSSSVNSGAGTESTASVFLNPAGIIDSHLQASNASTFFVYVNISSVVDLFSFQLNVTWNHVVLNLTRLYMGEFLNRTASASKTASFGLGYVINSTSNAKGYSSVADSILGGVPGTSGSGRLVSLRFRVVGYGCSNITISLGGSLPTIMLNSTMGSVGFTTSNGYFRNKLTGDANGDRFVNSLDIGALNARWSPAGGTPAWSLGYSRDVDTNDDGYINSLDMGVVNANWGRSI
jgi:hypothetical protein